MVQYVVEQYALIRSFKGRRSGQQFEQQNAQIPYVKGFVVTSLLDHLGCEVLGRPAVSLSLLIVIAELIRPAEVSQLDRTVAIKQDVLRLDVSMNDRRVETMQVLASRDHFSQILGGNTLTESAFPLDQSIDLALGRVLQNQIEAIVVLVVVVELDNVGVVQLVHYLNFELDLLDEVVLDDLSFVDHFDRIDILAHLVPHFVDFAEATNTDIAIG